MNDEQRQALSTAQAYVHRWVEGDFPALGDLLADDVSVVLPNSGVGPDPAYAFDGREAALGYLRSSFTTFRRLTFRDVEWVVAEDATSAYMHAVGDMITRVGAKPYRNVYVLRIHVRGERVTRVEEYTNPVIWNRLGLQ